MDMTPILIVGIIFGTLTAIVFGPIYLKFREKREMQETLRHAIDKGQELPAEVIDALTKDVSRRLPSRTKDIRTGIIWLAVGIGLAAFGLITGSSFGNDWDGNHIDAGLLGISAIPTTIGLAFIALSFFNPNKD
ncbi:DUF6249 domain-containing protein [Brevundimonas sp.]|uniref:DUF6249 domain-containing protein n=1 Tax=Brevundimonas sp. TaxID=1871086 RepID=UPI003F71DF9C